MNCPRCKRPFGTRKVGQTEVEACDRCGGLFLDRGELDRVAAPHQGDLEFSTVHGDSHQHEDAYGPTPCPRCDGVTMDKVEFNIYTNIILDHCPRCSGFWVDGRELKRINDEVRKLNAASDEVSDPPMLWFARFIWSLPR